MNGRIIGLRFDAAQSPIECAAAMQTMLRRLVESGAATYDLFLYPYVDALLLSSQDKLPMFGTHALLWGFDAKALADAAIFACDGRTAQLRPRARLLDNDARDIAAFLGENVYAPAEGEHIIGGFASLLSGNVRPWHIREQSRRLCSFCEHTVRTEGVTPIAMSGDGLIVRCDDERLDSLCELYSAKTGGCPTLLP